MHNGATYIDADAKAALQFLDPGSDRETWVRVLMAAKAAGVDESAAVAWSAAGPNFIGERDVRSVWRSIRADGGIGPGTLYGMARAAGWKARQGDDSRHPRPTLPIAARTSAAAVWERCSPATASHGYIARKGGTPVGLRVVGEPLRVAAQDVRGWLVVPVRSLAGDLLSLQFIPPEKGQKLNLPGHQMRGVFIVGELRADGIAHVVEGIGQAWACWRASGFASVVTFGAGRMTEVAKALRAMHPLLRLVLVPDVGKERDAETIARGVRGACATMPSGWEQNADVNDYAQREGFDALEALLHRAKAPLANGVVLLNGADLTPQPVAWLWRDWLALGKLHILAGAPGQGKTTIALAMAATVTSGGLWPDGSRCERGQVLIWSGEDDPADTLLPRLLAASADKTRVHFVSGTRTNGELEPFDPAYDMAQLEEQASRIGNVRLIVVDPVVSAVTGDSHKNTEVRRALQPLVDLAANMDATLLGISHFSKSGQGQDPASRVVGSIAFTAVARVVLVAAKVKGDDGKDRRILARGKSNIGPDHGGFEYAIAQVEALPGIHASRIEWGAAVEGSARELLTDPADETEEGNAKDSAAAFLQEVLKGDLVPVKSIEAEAKEAGIAWRTIRRASDSLGVIKKRGAENRWYWSLPKLSKTASLSNLSNVQTLDNLDNMPAANRETMPRTNDGMCRAQSVIAPTFRPTELG